jgi:N-acetylmuramic acid 6-phosphate etherase
MRPSGPAGTTATSVHADGRVMTEAVDASGPTPLDALPTESRNPRTHDLDRLPLTDLLTIMNDEDARVAPAVRELIPQIAQAVELVVTALGAGGRLVYVGAGTSGRIGLLDSVECTPTFGITPGRVVGLMAGGPNAFALAVEGAEDDLSLGERDVTALGVGAADVVIGLAASGRTPYVLGALAAARTAGAAIVGISCNPGSPLGAAADVAIEVRTGPEVLTGSTRLKAGTAQKLVCNMVTTAAMVRLGKVYGNLMVDLLPTNAKLVDRAQRIVQEATGCTLAESRAALRACGNHAKTAVVMVLAGCSAEEARARLTAAAGRVRDAIA